MAKIKSAIELAMERTRDLVMDEEEKQSFAVREIENKIKAVVRRYIEGMIDGNRLNREIDEIKGDKEWKKSILIDLLIDEFDVKTKNERLLELFNTIGGGLKEPFKHELEMMQKSFVEQLKKGEAAVRDKITGRLREIGIMGSGVEPNIQAWDEWGESMIEAGNAFRGSFIEWKNRLRAANK